MKKIFLLFFLILLFFSFPIEAFSGNVCTDPLVPCGPGRNPPKGVCKLCDIFVLFDNIMDFVLICIIPPVAILMIAIGGGMFVISAEDPKRKGEGLGLMKGVLIGLLIIYSAWLIVALFFWLIGLEGFAFTHYNKWGEKGLIEFKCD